MVTDGRTDGLMDGRMDAGNNNTRRPKLAQGNKNYTEYSNWKVVNTALNIQT